MFDIIEWLFGRQHKEELELEYRKGYQDGWDDRNANFENKLERAIMKHNRQQERK